MSKSAWNQWHEMWWQIAAKPWLDDAKIEMAHLLPAEVEAGADDVDVEDLARTVGYECAPIYNYDIEALAEINPLVWEYAIDNCDGDDYDGWGPGTEYQALQAGIAYYIFYELLDMLPHEDEEIEEWRPRFQAQYARYIEAAAARYPAS